MKKETSDIKIEDIFYRKYILDEKDDCQITFDDTLLAKAWKTSIKKTDEIFENKIRGCLAFFEPLYFNAKIALKCGLIPLSYTIGLPDSEGKRIYRVWEDALACPDDEETIRLDAYQVLTHGTIDRESTFFTDKEQFTSIVGKDIVAKMNEILNIEGREDGQKLIRC